MGTWSPLRNWRVAVLCIVSRSRWDEIDKTDGTCRLSCLLSLFPSLLQSTDTWKNDRKVNHSGVVRERGQESMNYKPWTAVWFLCKNNHSQNMIRYKCLTNVQCFGPCKVLFLKGCVKHKMSPVPPCAFVILLFVCSDYWIHSLIFKKVDSCCFYLWNVTESINCSKLATYSF